MAKADSDTPEEDPSPNGDVLADDDEEAQWSRVAPRLKELNKEAFKEALEEFTASRAESEESDEPEARPARAGRSAAPARRPARGAGAAALPSAPKLGGREAPAKPTRSGLLGLLLGN